MDTRRRGMLSDFTPLSTKAYENITVGDIFLYDKINNKKIVTSYTSLQNFQGALDDYIPLGVVVYDYMIGINEEIGIVSCSYASLENSKDGQTDKTYAAVECNYASTMEPYRLSTNLLCMGTYTKSSGINIPLNGASWWDDLTKGFFELAIPRNLEISNNVTTFNADVPGIPSIKYCVNSMTSTGATQMLALPPIITTNWSSGFQAVKQESNGNSLSASYDFYGKETTQKVLNAVYNMGTLPTLDLTTADNTKHHILYAAAYQYSPDGTQMGDWYVPSFGEISMLYLWIDKINASLDLISSKWESECISWNEDDENDIYCEEYKEPAITVDILSNTSYEYLITSSIGTNNKSSSSLESIKGSYVVGLNPTCSVVIDSSYSRPLLCRPFYRLKPSEILKN